MLTALLLSISLNFNAFVYGVAMHSLTPKVPTYYGLTFQEGVDQKKANEINQFLKANRTAPEVWFWLASPGGYVSAERDILNSMKRYQAQGGKIVCVADGWVASAAAAIYVSCDVHKFTPKTFILFHTVQVCTAGKNGDPENCHPARQYVPSEYAWWYEGVRHLQTMLWNVLTPEERTRYMNGIDIILPAEIVVERINRSKK